MAENFGGRNKAGRELIYHVRDEFKPPVEDSYSSAHPLLRRDLFEDPVSSMAGAYFRIQDPIQLSSSGQVEVAPEVFVGELMGMCTREEMVNKQLTSTANDFERLSGVTLSDDLEARIVNEFLAVKSFQRSDASRIFHKELVRPVIWCRMVVRRLLVYFIEADRASLSYLYRRPTGQDYKYIDIYNFLRDRLRAVWQDLTVQHATRHRASIDSFEVSFRFLLLSEEYLCNLKEFNSVQNGSLMSTCLDKLMSGYMDAMYHRKKSGEVKDTELSRILVYSSPFQPEFWSYRILASMSIKIKDADDNRVMDIINLVSPEIIQHPLVQLALGIHSSFRLVNIVRYFRYFRKCLWIILGLIKDQEGFTESLQRQVGCSSSSCNMEDSQNMEQYIPFVHALILICVLIKKYSNIIRLKYLNILLSSNMNRRQLMPLSSFIEVFGFYIESLESLRLFTERFGIKIFKRDDLSEALFSNSRCGFQSIHQIYGASSDFVVSFKDCINLSTTESLSILNSLSWPSELLMSLFEKIPRIDILDPIFEKIPISDFKLKPHTGDANYNKKSAADAGQSPFSLTSLSSKNRDIINRGYNNNSISNTLIKDLSDIDINKAANGLQLMTGSGNRNKRKGLFLDESPTSTLQACVNENNEPLNPVPTKQTRSTGKRRSLAEHGGLFSPDTNSTYNLQTQIKPIHFSPELPHPIHISNPNTPNKSSLKNARQMSNVDESVHAQICAGSTAQVSATADEGREGEGGVLPEKDVSREVRVGECEHDKECRDSREKVEEESGVFGGHAESASEFLPDMEGLDARDHKPPADSCLDHVIEDELVGLSGWKRYRVVLGNSQDPVGEADSREGAASIGEGENYRKVSILLSRIDLPEAESGISRWLDLSIYGILEHIKTDIISSMIRSLKFSFVFFYNQIVGVAGVSRSHTSQLNTFYTKLELVLSNLTSKDFLGGAEKYSSEQGSFIFPWNSVMVRSELHADRRRGNMIIDIFETDFSHSGHEVLQGIRQPQVPVHVEMLSVWQDNSTCLRSQLFSDEDISTFREKEESPDEANDLTLERLIYEYLINNGDVIVWTLPFLLKSSGHFVSSSLGTGDFIHLEDLSDEYMRRSMESFALEVSSRRGREQIIGEFQSCCRVLNARRYPVEEVRTRIPILKTVTIFLSFVAYVPITRLELEDASEAFQQRIGNEIRNLESNFEDIVLRECLQEGHVLVISNDVVSMTPDQRRLARGREEPDLISSYSGVACDLKFKCIGVAPLELLQDSARRQDCISTYAPGLHSLINARLDGRSFPNNIVISNGYSEDLEVDPASFLSTMWLQNFYKEQSWGAGSGCTSGGGHPSLAQTSLRETLRRGFIECFSLFTNGNIDWILVSGDCSYTEIKEIIVWIYDLYVHSMVCLDTDSSSSQSMERALPDLPWGLKDPCKIRDLSRVALKQYEKCIKSVSDTFRRKCETASPILTIPKVIWNVLFDHLEPLRGLTCILSDSTLFEYFSGLIAVGKDFGDVGESAGFEQEKASDPDELLSRMDSELFKPDRESADCQEAPYWRQTRAERSRRCDAGTPRLGPRGSPGSVK
ncbi:hypothetical protein OJ253_2066 [Cryptosporidium canis]|uniref:SAC3/GANP/THP3 conserved domain-containing protein n=1 Tax=Cryptosporidium canis TaxID=195482 RepID=A0A9D5HX01_9CRYT|nr:hypothetical protein OJ253_2066 [Cryptosporidium canis]